MLSVKKPASADPIASEQADYYNRSSVSDFLAVCDGVDCDPLDPYEVGVPSEAVDNRESSAAAAAAAAAPPKSGGAWSTSGRAFSSLPDVKSISGNSQPEPYTPSTPTPHHPRAFALRNGETWPYAGLPLSALKRLFRDKFIPTANLACYHCGKSGHNVDACPLSNSDRSGARSVFLSGLSGVWARQTHASTVTVIKSQQSLHDAISALEKEGKRLNADNPFLDKPGTSLWALPKRIGWWRAINAPSFALSWIAFGYQLRFLSPVPRVGFENHPGAFTHFSFIDEELKKRVERGQFSVVDQSFAHVINPLDVVKKSSGGHRLILDCRLVNGFLPDIPFRLENLSVVPQIVTKGQWLFSTDLEDAYFHIPMHPLSRPYLCFKWRDVVYTTNVLPFGLNLAPFIFTKMLRPVIRFCRSLGISVIAYLDDFLWCDDRHSIDGLVAFARALLGLLGFSVSDKKSEWTPTQLLQFLGLLVNAEAYAFEVPKGKLQKIGSIVSDLIARAEKRSAITTRQVAAVCGHLLSVRLAVAPARIYTRALYRVLNSASHWDQRLVLPPDALTELKFWSENLHSFTALGMVPAKSVLRLYCDSSEDGWGAHTIGVAAFGMFEAAEIGTSSTHRELLGLLSAIRTPSIRKAIANRRITFVLDSRAAVQNLLKGGGPKPDLCELVKAIWTECLSLNSDAGAEWIAREENELADQLSKFRERADWSLHPDLFFQLDTMFGPHTVDRFAARHNTLCARYNSLHYDSGAEAIDAFKQNWAGENNFVNAAFSDIDRVLQQTVEQRSTITLVFPLWESAPWFNQLQSLASRIVWLPSLPGTFIPGPRSSRMFLTTPPWPVGVARIDCSQTRKRN